MQKVRWGIVGAGRIADTFAGDIVHVPNAELVAVAARKRDDAMAFAGKYGIARAHGGYESLFADADVDAIYIATPHTRHLPNALDALAAGKHVLCEKPLTVSVDECRTLLSAAEASQRFLMEALWTSFLPAIACARQWVEEGRIGDLRRVRADFGFTASFDPHSRLYDKALGGGCLLDIGIYPLALTRLLSGAAPVSVKAEAAFAPTGVEDELAMTLDYPGFVADLRASFRRELPNNAVITGSQGRIVIPRFWQASECRLLDLDGEHVIGTFTDQRSGSGFEFQIEAASADILAGRSESGVVSHAVSLGLQEDMARVAGCYVEAC